MLDNNFPLLNRKTGGKPFVYLDSAATSQKPLVMINAISDYYKQYNANIHRGSYRLCKDCTGLFDNTRLLAKNFFNAPREGEKIFTKGTTEGIHLVAHGWGDKFFKSRGWYCRNLHGT